jgi:hypothetical protein
MTPTTHHTTRRVLAAIAIGTLSLGAVACSDDDGDDDDIDNPVDGVDDQVDDGLDELEDDIESETTDG